MFKVQHRHGARTDIGCITSPAIASDGEHVGLGFSGRYGGNNLQSLGIDHRHGVAEFGGDIEQSIFGPHHRAMRSDAFSKVYGSDDVALFQINYTNQLTVSSRFSNAGIPVDWNIC